MSALVNRANAHSQSIDGLHREIAVGSSTDEGLEG